MKKTLFTLISLSFLVAQTPDRINKKIDKMADRLEKKVINWRRDFHQNPELSNREFKTSEKVAKHLKSLVDRMKREFKEIGRASCRERV